MKSDQPPSKKSVSALVWLHLAGCDGFGSPLVMNYDGKKLPDLKVASDLRPSSHSEVAWRYSPHCISES